MVTTLTQKQLRRLEEYKYVRKGHSITEPFMQKCWWALANRMPLSWSPTVISLVGLTINILVTVTVIIYSPDGKTEAPRWVYGLCAFGVLAYQTADAMDGKQEIRTKTESALGELVDHGCDSVSTAMISLGVCISLRLGCAPWWMMFEVFMASFLFHMSHCQINFSHCQQFSKFDITESQFGCMFIHLCSALFGPTFWDYEMPIIGMSLRMMAVCFALIPTLINCKSNFNGIIGRRGIGKTLDGANALYPVVPALLVVFLGVGTATLSTTIYTENACLYLFTFGIALAKVSLRLVITHLTQAPLELFDGGTLGPVLLFLNVFLPIVPNGQVALFLCLVWCVQDIVRYALSMLNQVCSHLKINCIYISRLPEKNRNNPGKG